MICPKCESKDCIKDGTKILGKKGRGPVGRCGGCGYRGPLEKFSEKKSENEDTPLGEGSTFSPPSKPTLRYDPPLYMGTIFEEKKG